MGVLTALTSSKGMIEQGTYSSGRRSGNQAAGRHEGWLRHVLKKTIRISCSDAAEYYVAPIRCLGPRSPLSFALKLLFFAQCTRAQHLSLIHISEPTRLGMISYA